MHTGDPASSSTADIYALRLRRYSLPWHSVSASCKDSFTFYVCCVSLIVCAALCAVFERGVLFCVICIFLCCALL
jgi:hypothetical protein